MLAVGMVIAVVLAAIAFVTPGSSNAPATGVQVPSLAEHNALEERVTALEQGQASDSTRLDDHDVRLDALESHTHPSDPDPTSPSPTPTEPSPTVPAGTSLIGSSDGVWPIPGYTTVPVVRAFLSGTPATWQDSGELRNAYNRSTKAIWISWKSQDAGWLDRFLATAPKDRTIIATYNHEPENDSPPAPEEYQATWAKQLPVIHKHGALAATALLGHLSNTQNDPFWVPGVDICGFDRYNPGLGNAKQYTDPATVFGRVINYCKSKGKPLGIAETGTIEINGDQAGRVEWARKARAVLINAGVPYATWWNQNWSGTAGGGMAMDGPTAKAWLN